MPMNTTTENVVLNYLFGKTLGFTPPTNYYMSLHMGDPTVAGLLTSEVTGGAYARATLTPLMGTATNTYINNVTDIVFPQATANWGNITHIGVMTTSTLTTGIMVLYASLAATITINNNEQFRINASNLTFQAI